MLSYIESSLASLPVIHRLGTRQSIRKGRRVGRPLLRCRRSQLRRRRALRLAKNHSSSNLMLIISTPLSASQALRYHREEFANGQANYYSECDIIRGQWHGKLAEQWGLQGEVREEQFSLLASGQHPITGELLVRHNTPREYVNKRGEK